MELRAQTCIAHDKLSNIQPILVSASVVLKQATVPEWGKRNGQQQPWKAVKRAGGARPRVFVK